MQDIVQLGRLTLQTALLVAGPILLIATVVSLLISIAQVLTSIQDSTAATVPRLAATAIAAIALMPWMLRQLATFTVRLFEDFQRFARP